jgi:hypothetical protein
VIVDTMAEAVSALGSTRRVLGRSGIRAFWCQGVRVSGGEGEAKRELGRCGD